MECPRCGGRLTRYRLDDRETVGCQQCAYVGVSVDHTATHGPPESWDDAIDRFQAQGQSVKRVTREDLPAEVPPADSVDTGEAMARELVDDEDWVVPVFDEADAETTASAEDRDDAEPVEDGRDMDSADDVDDAETTDSADDMDDAETTDSADDMDDAETTDPADDVDDAESAEETPTAESADAGD